MNDLTPSSTESKVVRLRKQIAEEEALRHLEWANNLFSRCQSPIEELLFASILSQSYGLIDWFGGEFSDRIVFNGASAHGYLQARVGKYVCDLFFVRWIGTDAREFIVVECDGHEFHERTKEQARKDRSRDRWMTAQGIKVLRFTGSEIYGDTEACAEQIFEVVLA